MWIFTKYGYFSAVCARKGKGEHGQPVDPTRMMIRARDRQHLEALKDRFTDLLGKCEIMESAGTDYAFRLFVEKSAWTSVLSELGNETDYDNFKSAVAHHLGRQGADYLDSLHDVWSVMHRFQSGDTHQTNSRPKADATKVIELIKSFDSDRELKTSHAYGDGGVGMLFPRLDRAAVNQAEDGEATLSRYAIWANTVRDHIAEAERLLREDGDSAEAERLLIHAHNSLSAFSEVQSLFDPFK